MDCIKAYLHQLFVADSIHISNKRKKLFDEFCQHTETVKLINGIFKAQIMLKRNWGIQNRINDIQAQSFLFPNASVGKYYEHKLDFDKLNIHDIVELKFSGLEEIGLMYDAESKIIKGNPIESGDLKLTIDFVLENQDDPSSYNQKYILLIINPDPKSLWKDFPSDPEIKFWKEDNVEISGLFLDKHVVISSKRGRSHANIGSARDDHFRYENLNNGWSIIAVSDGAGSAKYSREGSRIACEFIIGYFSERCNGEEFLSFDNLVKEYISAESTEVTKKINQFVYDTIGNGAFQTHKKLESLATELEIAIKDLHATFIFCLVKKYEFGYVILSFSVGDCPIALINKNFSEVKLLNHLDVGDYGGGTRFITMPEIFDPVKLQNRFDFKVVEDFSYLFLMTDGVYDPKFVTESNLERLEKWKAFISDLKGDNADGTRVDFDYENQDIAVELSKWMDFWDSGNHDDRTLAIIY